MDISVAFKTFVGYKSKRNASFLALWTRGSICFCLLLLLVGCQGPSQPINVTPQHKPVTYESLCGLTADQFGAMSETRVLDWIKIQNGHILEPLTSGMFPDEEKLGVIHYSWKGSNQTLANTAYIRNGKLIRVFWPDIKNRPTFGDVVASLGAPEKLYRTAKLYEKALYSIGLEYHTLGITVYSDRIVEVVSVLQDGKLILPFSADMPVQHVECYKGGSLEQVLHEIFFMSSESISATMNSLMSWPGFEKTWIPYDNP